MNLFNTHRTNDTFNSDLGNMLGSGEICGIKVTPKDIAEFMKEGERRGLVTNPKFKNRIVESVPNVQLATPVDAIDDCNDIVIDDVVTDITVAEHYISKMKNAKKRKIEFTLSLSDMRKLLSRKTCYYTGIKFSDEPKYYKTLDRIDASKGYTAENTVACCHIINKIKNDLFENEASPNFVEVDLIIKFLKKWKSK